MRGLLAVLLLTGCSHRVTLLKGPGPGAPKQVLIRNATVFDGEHLVGARDVLLEGGNIAAVGPTGSLHFDTAPEETIDGTGKTLMPGLMDLHLHVGALQGEPPWVISLLDPPTAEEQLAAALYAGVTTALLAGHEADSEGLSQQERDGAIASPRLFRASRIFAAEDGHPAGLYASALPWPVSSVFIGRAIRAVGSPAEARESVREEIAEHHPSVIKVVYDDLPPGKPKHSKETLVAIIDEAKKNNVRAVVHVGGPQEAIEAVQAGAALLMHTPWEAELTVDQLVVLAQAHVPLVTTMRVWGRSGQLLHGPATDFTALEKAVMQPGVEDAFAKGPPEGWSAPGFEPSFFETAKAYGPNTAANLLKLREAGVPLLVGTDSGITGVFQGAAVHRELAALVALGFPAEEALAMGTARAGEFLAPGSGLGTIAPGAPADVLLIDGDPIADINATEKLAGIWHRGKRVR